MNEINKLVLKVENVSKIYKLGEIGGTTLKEEFQRFHAKVHKKEDLTKKIGAKNYNKGEAFKALDGVSFEVKKGERIGIIGHNGAGKSTLLKLISRVTTPSEGMIGLNGRVASMLEVGTGFHEELTGRENIYMNGAILGMTKKEIDNKIESIIDFSEVREFIDTPVKRYSSGMHVKLGFAVASHLDSEIVIMDEVLAVGDMAFQNKCLTQMRKVSEEEGRTILYVSHNMSTIRQLCDRVIVLSHGKLIFNGDVEEGISIYLNQDKADDPALINSSVLARGAWCNLNCKINEIQLLNKNEWRFIRGEPIVFKIKWKSEKDLENIHFRVSMRTSNDVAIGSFSEPLSEKVTSGKEYESIITIENTLFHNGMYYFTIGLFQIDESKNITVLDTLSRVIHFEILTNNESSDTNNSWTLNNWGAMHLNGLNTETKEKE